MVFKRFGIWLTSTAKKPVDYLGVTYTSAPLVDRDELLSEWKIFTLCKEKELIVRLKKLSTPPSMQEVLQSMRATEAYKGIFPQTIHPNKYPFGLASWDCNGERSFSQMKLIQG